MSWEDVLKVGVTIIASLGGSGAIILGLSKYFGDIFAKKLLEDQKGKITQQLEEQKAVITEHLKKIDRAHNISQETLSKLFEKKKETYEKLIEAKTKYTKTVNEDFSMIYEDSSAYPYINLFNSIREIIDSNRLLISDLLSEKYDELYSKIVWHLMEIDKFRAKVESRNDGSNEFFDWAIDGENERDKELHDDTFTQMSAVLKQIDVDSSKFRKTLDEALK